VYILYLDDFGSVANPAEDYFVLGGVCVPETSIRWLSHQVECIAQEVAPADPGVVEFHASEIFGGRDGVWKTIPAKVDRIAIIKRVLKVLDNAYADVVIFACAVHKRSFPAQDPVQMAFEDLSSRFDLFLRRKAASGESSPKGLIVVDKSSYESSLQNLTAVFRREGNKWGSYLKSICEVPMFVDSSASRNIQLADHIAYAVFRRYNAGDLTYYDCIEGRFDQDPTSGVIHGLVHRQLYKRNCTCPACITRR